MLADKARADNDLGETHSVEEAEDNHHDKLAAQPRRLKILGCR
ncbi:MAG: hypothetical protein WKG07_42155 [Hymenobacter sp.]